MDFDHLIQFIERDMRMAHVYQPVMLRELLNRGGCAHKTRIFQRFCFSVPPRKSALRSKMRLLSLHPRQRLNA